MMPNTHSKIIALSLLGSGTQLYEMPRCDHEFWIDAFPVDYRPLNCEEPE